MKGHLANTGNLLFKHKLNLIYLARLDESNLDLHFIELGLFYCLFISSLVLSQAMCSNKLYTILRLSFFLPPYLYHSEVLMIHTKSLSFISHEIHVLYCSQFLCLTLSLLFPLSLFLSLSDSFIHTHTHTHTQFCSNSPLLTFSSLLFFFFLGS